MAPLPPPPSPKWPLRLPAGEIAAMIGCRACRVLPGQPCDFTRLTFTLLPWYFDGAPRVHTRRYADALTAAALTPWLSPG